MNAHALKVLEYRQVREMLAEYASCELGKERIAALAPMDEEVPVCHALKETSEAKQLLETAGQIPLGGIHDVRTPVRSAAIGAMLEPGTLLDVAETLAGTRRLREFLVKREETAPRLAEIGR